jgi:hypothetical protein
VDFLADVAGEAFYELGEIRLRMGDLPGASEMFGVAHSRGRDPEPGLALLRLAEGRSEAARSMIERALIEPGLTALDRAKLLPALVEIRLACGETTAAEEGASELETITTTYTSPALVASAALAPRQGRARGWAGRAGHGASPARLPDLGRNRLADRARPNQAPAVSCVLGSGQCRRGGAGRAFGAGSHGSHRSQSAPTRMSEPELALHLPLSLLGPSRNSAGGRLLHRSR